MNKQIGIFAALPLVLTLAHGACASVVLYDNGPINGTNNAYTINHGWSVSDSFTLAGASTVGGANFGLWTSAGDKVKLINWTISSGSLGAGTVFGAGTSTVSDTLVKTGVFGSYDINMDSISIPTLNLNGGSYFFSLGSAVTTNAGYAYWDLNNGPSTAFQTTNGKLPGSQSFQILGPSVNPVPEPSQTASLALGLVALGGLMAFARKHGNAPA